MKLLREISESNIGVSPAEEILGRSFFLRKSARGIILNDRNEISIQHVTNKNYYKLPGGGVEMGESLEEALHREIKEEVGCEITIEAELGLVIEYRTKHDLLHMSYGYLGKVQGEVGKPAYEQGEIDDGFVPLWMSIEKALELIDDSKPVDDYQGKFVVPRERTLLLEAQKFINV